MRASGKQKACLPAHLCTDCRMRKSYQGSAGVRVQLTTPLFLLSPKQGAQCLTADDGGIYNPTQCFLAYGGEATDFPPLFLARVQQLPLALPLRVICFFIYDISSLFLIDD